ncbi:MAG: hypothetical protein QY320_02890 [Gammaproteobacteria bacterium]|nr:MAG: hypothetical protein QY320_02890 [Gammaproteobacteria bacterium]
MRSASSMPWSVAVLVLAAAIATGCASVGPRTVVRDRFDYNATIADSWKEQTLLNIVKLRYMDLPMFLDVGQIVAGYTVESSGALGAALTRGDVPDSDVTTLGGTLRYTDRPTITYSPLTGDRFLRGLMTPIRPGSVFALLQSGYEADFVLALGLESLNGLHNPVSTQGGQPSTGAHEFTQALTLLREIQIAGALTFRMETGPHGEEMLMFFRQRDMPAETVAKIEELRSLLGMEATDGRYSLIYSPVPGSQGEFAVLTRSMLQILLALAGTVDVPQQHIDEHRASLVPRADSEQMPFRVRSGEDRPQDAYAAVSYRNRWFWIDDTDYQTKRAFSFIMFLFTLSEEGNDQRLPVLTIPTG